MLSIDEESSIARFEATREAVGVGEPRHPRAMDKTARTRYRTELLPNESRVSCGAPMKDSFHNLCAPPASRAG